MRTAGALFSGLTLLVFLMDLAGPEPFLQVALRWPTCGAHATSGKKHNG